MFSSAARSSGFVRLHAGKASARGRGGRLHLGDRCFGGLGDHVLGRRVHDLVATRVTVDALAADEEPKSVRERRCCHAGETRTRSRGDAYRGSQITTGMSRSVRSWYPA